MNFRKLWKGAAVCLVMASLAAGMAGCGGAKSESAANAGGNTAKVGFLNAVTGGVAAYGVAEKEGFDLAVEEVNKEGKVHFDVEMADTQGNVQQCVSMARKMISDKKVIVIGPLISGEYKAVGPLFQEAKIPLLGSATTAEGLMDIGDYMFRNCVPESKNIPQTVSKTHKLLNYKTAAILYSNNNEHQVSAYNSFVKALDQEGVSVVATETFADKDTDFSAQLTKIEAAHPDVVVVAGYYQEGGLILKKMREMGMNQPVLGDNGFVSPELVKIAGSAADNVYVSSMWSPDRDSQATRDFVKNFRAKYNHDPDNFAACAYVSVKLAAKAMEDAGTTTDSTKVRDALSHIKNFESAVGPMTFNNSGDPEVDLVLLKIENGKYNAVKV
jgi:branched-chain amino acid transport system substrate-binding protein